jgi:hypothetical protein
MSDTILPWRLVGFSDLTETGRCCFFAFHLSAATSAKNDPLAFRTRIGRKLEINFGIFSYHTNLALRSDHQLPGDPLD